MTRSMAVDLGDDDSRSGAQALPFSFYGFEYSQILVDSDGNLTFDGADQASRDREWT